MRKGIRGRSLRPAMVVALAAMALVCAVPPADAGRDAENAMSNGQRIEHYFNAVNADTMDLLGEFYAADVVFQDPLVRLEGLPALRAHYEKLYRNVRSIHFDFSAIIGEQEDGHQSYAAFWTMTMSAEGLNGGDPVVVAGSSHIRFRSDDQRVVYHRDYFDMGQLVYEHVPLVGRVIGHIKGRLQD